MAKGEAGKIGRKSPQSGAGRTGRGKPETGKANPELPAQNRKLMGKHYAAKHGVRKGRG